MDIDVLVNSDATPTEVAAVQQVVREAGLHGSVQANWSSRAFDQSPWVVALLAPLGVFWSAFFAALGTEAGKDAYRGLRRLVSRLFDTQPNLNGCVELWDEETRTHIILTDDLPAEAYAQLAERGIESLQGGYWTWDPNRNGWNRL